MIEFNKNNIWTFDIETMASVFSVLFWNVETGEKRLFEVSKYKDDSKELFRFLTWFIKNEQMSVSFNGMKFDIPVMHKFYNLYMAGLHEPIIIRNRIYEYAQWVIKDAEQFFRVWKPYWIDIDLYKINHYDNRAKATSLKKVECFLNMETVQELPCDIHDPDLTKLEVGQIVDYMDHDVLATKLFFEWCCEKGYVQFRFGLIEDLGIQVLNYSDSKIGSEIMTRELIDKMGYDKVFTNDNGRRKAIQSDYPNGFEVAPLIFPYIKFETPEGNAILDFFKSQTLTGTKNVFSELDLNDVGNLAKYVHHELTNTEIRKSNVRKFIDDGEFELDKKDYPILPHGEDGKPLFEYDKMNTYRQKYWDHLHLSEAEYKEKWKKENKKTGEISYCKETHKPPTKLKHLNVILGGIKHDLGSGGIHSAVESGIYRSDDEYQILDIDVASYYVAMQIVNKIGASHYDINVWIDVLKQLKKNRETYDKSDPINKSSKIAQLTIYGNYNNEHSNLRDQKTLVQICINGQLSLLMLCELLTKQIPNLKILSANTDGLSLAIPRKNYQEAIGIVEDFEDISGLLFEAQKYDVIYQSDVNNFIWVA